MCTRDLLTWLHMTELCHFVQVMTFSLAGKHPY